MMAAFKTHCQVFFSYHNHTILHKREEKKRENLETRLPKSTVDRPWEWCITRANENIIHLPSSYFRVFATIQWKPSSRKVAHMVKHKYYNRQLKTLCIKVKIYDPKCSTSAMVTSTAFSFSFSNDKTPTGILFHIQSSLDQNMAKSNASECVILLTFLRSFPRMWQSLFMPSVKQRASNLPFPSIFVT